MALLFTIVFFGVVFDAIGLAAAAAEEKPFHAMAARKVSGSKQAIGIIRRADQFSNICNDVIGDISGIISGAVAFAVVTQMMVALGNPSGVVQIAINVLLTSIVAAVTVGGKALGKSFAITYANEIVFQVAKLFYFLESRFHIKLFNVRPANDKKQHRKREIKECYLRKSTHPNG